MEAMTGAGSDRTALTRLAEAFVDDVLNASDEDILAEAHEDHSDPAAVAAQAKVLFEKAVILAGKGKLTAVRTALSRLRLGYQRGDPTRHRYAVPAYGAALTVFTRDAMPTDGASTQNNRANTLSRAGAFASIDAPGSVS